MGTLTNEQIIDTAYDVAEDLLVNTRIVHQDASHDWADVEDLEVYIKSALEFSQQCMEDTTPLVDFARRVRTPGLEEADLLGETMTRSEKRLASWDTYAAMQAVSEQLAFAAGSCRSALDALSDTATEHAAARSMEHAAYAMRDAAAAIYLVLRAVQPFA